MHIDDILDTIATECRSYLQRRITGNELVRRIDPLLGDYLPEAKAVSDEVHRLMDEFQNSIAHYEEEEEWRRQKPGYFGPADLAAGTHTFLEQLSIARDAAREGNAVTPRDAGMSTLAVVRARIRDDIWHSFTVSAEEIAALDKELDETISAIKGSHSFAEAAADFDTLANLHGVLCLLWFKYHAAVSPKQQEFVCKYDRHDDPDVLRMTYEAIKEDRYPQGRWP